MNERDIFTAARGIPDEAKRAAYLDDACGADADLRAQVEQLLREQEQLGSFLESPATRLMDAAAAQTMSETAGTVIGSYKLLEQIGEGGFGIVFMAEQQRPVRRKVALKVLKPGMDTRQVIARFEAERQALALMDHPNIAKVLDGGETASGRPYFVMDLVKGLPITEYCDQAQLTPRERLELFVSVCQAVQHAHQKGVIHRDLKPSNVLVTQQDGAPLAKIIDFGIAKALGQQLTDKTLFTGFVQLIGTPLYMSPEQAALSNVDVDTRSDIYALGVLLYELLTGTTPFDKERLTRATYEEMRRIIREEEPLKPSTRLSTLGQAARAMSAQRKSDPYQLTQLVRGELDWIVMKALDKDRNRRYETANGLARDIERYLHDEPVQACPPSAAYRLRKLVRRYKLALAVAAGAFFLVAVTAIGASVAALMLHAEQKATRQQLELTQKAEQEGTRRLFRSLLAQARALRMSRHPGQRIESLRSIAEAMRLPLPPGHTLAELRTEAVAALALPDMEVVHTWQGGLKPGIVYVALDEKREKYATLAEDGTVVIRQVADDSLIARWKEAADRAYRGGGLLCFSRDGRYIFVLNIDSRRLAVRWLSDRGPKQCYRGENACDWHSVAFTPDSTQVVHVMTDTRIAIVELASGKVRYLSPTGAEQHALEFAPDGRRFAIGVNRNGQNAVEVRDLATGQVQVALPHPAKVHFAIWHPDGRTLATCCDDLLIRLWDLPSRKVVRSLRGHKTPGIRCAFDSTGRMLASNDWNGICRLWEVSSGRQLLSFAAADYPPYRISPDDRLAVVNAADITRAQLLRLHGSRAYQTIATGGVPLNLSVHPEGRFLAANPDHRPLVLIELATGRELASLPIADVRGLFWESSGALLTGGRSGLLRWPARSPLHPALPREGIQRGEPEDYRFGPPERLLSNTPRDTWGFGADGQTIAMPNYNQGAVVLHRGSSQRTVCLEPQQDVRTCAISPDGRWVATGSHTNADGFSAKVWEAATGRLEKALPLPPTCSVAFSPDGHWLLTTGGGCRLWKVGTWTEGPTVGGSEGCFSPDSRLLAVEDTAGAIRLLSTDTGALVVRLEAPEQTRLVPRSFTPDGTRLNAAGIDTEALHVWDLREVRRGLTLLGLDWDEPPYPPISPKEEIERRAATGPLKITVDQGDLEPARARALEEARSANQQAWPLAAGPDAKERDPARAIELAHKAVTLAPKEGNYWNTLGVAHYRAGHWKDAIEALTKAMELQKGAQESFDTFFLAMAHWQLGSAGVSDANQRARHQDEARKWYEKAVRWMDKNQHQLESNKEWQEELRRFRAEAEELLGMSKIEERH
jgi:serine/threonine protein kinase/WD40 repeat protein